MQFLKETFSTATLPALVTSAFWVVAMTLLKSLSLTYETTLSLIQEMMIMKRAMIQKKIPLAMTMKSQRHVVDSIFEDSYVT